jgi:hypothetical protein
MVSIADAVARIKDDPHAAIQPHVAAEVCRELGLEWKQTPLTPPVTLSLLLQQVLAGNCSNPEVLRHAGLTLTPAAYCTAKGRLPVAAVEEISRRVCRAAGAQAAAHATRWRGHRTWHVDGSSFSMPDTPELQAYFGQPSEQNPGCGFPVAHLLALFGADTGLIQEVILSPLNTSDVATAPQVHHALASGDVVIADQAFGSYFHLALLARQGAHGVFPTQAMRIVNFRHHRRSSRPNRAGRVQGQPTSRWVKSLGHHDQLVEYCKPRRPAWMTVEEYQALPDTLLVRELRRTLRRPGCRPRTLTISTTLLDPRAYPAAEIVKLLERRWDVETNLRHLKTTLGLEVLRTQTVAGVTRELWAFVLIYNLVRVILLEAATRQRVPVARLSFADALYWMRHAHPGQSLPRLLVNPHRPGRREPRALKRRPKYPRLRTSRAVLRKRLKQKDKCYF